jgi:acetyl esterase/lipase
MLKFILACFSFIITSYLFAQCDTLRYQSAIFDSIETHSDVKYGEAQVWNFPYGNTDLFMDIYEPINDSLTKRPLMIWVHPGGFLLGSKEADDMIALCDSFAKRGYVTASINYRLGFNPLSVSSAERAVYRGLQDARAAIRFLKENHLNYGIDTNYTFIGGSSAGGFSALHTAYLEQSEAPSSIDGGLTYPDLGCLDCSGNNFQHDMDLKGVVNLWGALGDSNWVSPYDTVPALLIHGTEDGVVPFGTGHPFGVFTTPVTHGSRCVSNQLNAYNIDHTTHFFEGQDHEPHGTSNGDFDGVAPTPYWDTIFKAVEKHYYSILNPGDAILNAPLEVCLFDTVEVSASNGDYFCWYGTNYNIIEQTDSTLKLTFTEVGNQTLSTINYSELWAAGNGASTSILVRDLPNSSYDYTLSPPDVNFSANTLGYTNYVWDFDDGTVLNGIAPTHTYTSPNVYYPTLFVTDSYGCSNSTSQMIDYSTLQLNSEELKDLFIVYPNPSQDKLHIKSNHLINEVSVFNNLGKQVHIFMYENSENYYTLDISSLPSGIFTLKARLDDRAVRIMKFNKF